MAEYLWLSRCLEDLPNGVLRIIDTHDLMHQRLLEYRNAGLHSFFQCTLEAELQCLRRANAVLAIQELDKKVLEHHLSNATVLHVPHGNRIPALTRKSDKNLVFIGSAHSANVEGLSWFLTKFGQEFTPWTLPLVLIL